MGSVISDIECPNCNQEAYDDFYYKTGEEYVNCNHCGYHYSATIKNRDKKLSELTDDDWEMKELKNPYGAYRLKYYDSVAYQCGALENEQNCVELLVEVKALNNVEYFSINRFVDGEIIKMSVIDNGPKIDGAGFSEEDREIESDDLPF